jgi:hypothetical protein
MRNYIEPAEFTQQIVILASTKKIILIYYAKI